MEFTLYEPDLTKTESKIKSCEYIAEHMINRIPIDYSDNFNKDKNVTVQEAMKVVTKAIKEDEGYRVGWQANISTAFKDRYNRYDEIHDIANDAADNFLTLLTKDVGGNK